MFEFTDKMKMNIEHIDKQHKGLVDFVNHAATLSGANPTSEEMKECLDFMGEYVIQHFGDEEKLQIESQYPYFPAHKKIHTDFVQTFKGLYLDFEINGPTSKLAFALSYTVSDWLIEHIEGEDAKFGKYFTKSMTCDLYEHKNGEKKLIYSSFSTSELPLFLAVHYGIDIKSAKQTAEKLMRGEESPPFGYKSLVLSLKYRTLSKDLTLFTEI
ncbi:MAG: hemerythrin family protein [Peptococcaceae bacterium]|nr:hemerythrin family protein [Peptococcaceae bacterium]